MNKNVGTDIPFKPDVMLIPSWLGYLESGSGIFFTPISQLSRHSRLWACTKDDVDEFKHYFK